MKTGLLVLFLSVPLCLDAFLASKLSSSGWRSASTGQRSVSKILLTTSTTASDVSKQSVAVVGCGAVGSYYGARLWEAGVYNVKFHMRGEHFQASTSSGLNVTSVHGDIFIPPEDIAAYETTEEIGPVDWVIVALKSSSLDVIPELISPLLHDGTRVVCIMNGLIEEDLVAGLNRYAGGSIEDEATVTCCAAVYGGMALICSNRLAPGAVDHSYAGLLTGGLAASSTGNDASASKDAFTKLWEPTKVEISYEDSLRRGRWKKCVWNLPYNGISVAMGGVTVDVIVNDPSLRHLADLVMDETIAAANADLLAHGEDSSMLLGDVEVSGCVACDTVTPTSPLTPDFSTTELQKKLMTDLSDNMGPYKTSTMLDLTQRKPMEVQYMFTKPVERARKLNVPVPHLETLVAQIEAMQRMYNLF
jgi:2-dehydropantoate 2-reductase